ncbi:hypothetical protein BH23CHL6_BH23CHL6_01970 [soil metagenome]
MSVVCRYNVHDMSATDLAPGTGGRARRDRVVASQAVRRLGEAMSRTSMDAGAVARILGKDPKTVSRWLRQDTLPRWQTREQLLSLNVLLERLVQVIAPAATEEWLFTPVPALDHERPVDLIRSGQHRRVMALIDSLGEGAFA